MPDVPKDIAVQAAGIQAELNAAVNAARTNGDLTTEARLRRLAAAFYKAEAEMGDLRQGWEQTNPRVERTLTRDVFGAANTTGADAISVRDADDRAAQLDDPEKALALLDTAENNGDQVLARAIAQRALNGYLSEPFAKVEWGAVVDAYTETRHDIGDKIAALVQQRTNTAMGGVMSGFIFGVPMPQELENLTASQRRALAAV